MGDIHAMGILLTLEEEESLQQLGRRVRQARLLRDMTQEQLASLCGCSGSTIKAMEAGMPGTSIGVYIRAMAAFGYTSGLTTILAEDPIGETLATSARRRSRRKVSGNVADF
jgi:transcriptional regulator with XRE-family HTH domain